MKTRVARRMGTVLIAVSLAWMGAAGCGGEGEDSSGPALGDLEVSASTAGDDLDTDGYLVKLSSGSERSITANGAGTFSDLSEGSYEVELTGVAVNCAVSGSNPRTVTVSAGGTARTTFSVSCVSNVGVIEVAATSAGVDIDPDGYTVVLDGTISSNVAANAPAGVGEGAAAAVVEFDDVPAGQHEIELRDMTPNCSVNGSNPRSVTVSFNATTEVSFEVDCVAMVGDVEVTTTTSGTDIDPDGYDVTVDGSVAGQVDVNGSLTLSDVAAGSRQIGLTGLSANCAVVGENPRSVDVAFGTTTPVSMAVACGADLGHLEVTASTTGADLDPDGYTVTVDGSLNQSVASNGDVTFSNLTAGDHTVELSGVAANCTVGGANPRTVAVTASSTASTTFDVNCTSLTGAVELTTSTTGSDIDPDGYTITVDGGSAQAIGANDTLRIEGLPVGDHDLELTGVAVNCSVTGSNPRVVSVPSGGTAITTFVVSCVQLIGDLDVATSTTGLDIDPNGYTVTLDGSLNQAIGVNGAVSFDNLDVGAHTVELSGIAVNCSVDGDNPRQVDVPFDDTAQTTFDVSCVALTGDLTVNVSSSGVDIDPDGYILTLDGTTVRGVSVNDQVVFQDLPAGDHTLDLSDIATNCGVFTGENPRTVTVTGLGDVSDFDVTCWGPLRNKIAFETDQHGDWDIFIMNTDGTGRQRLTTWSGRDRQPDVSPDGLRIAFMSDRDGGNDIYVMAADGSGVTNLSQIGGNEFGPVWSPDGTKVAFSRRSGGFSDVWVVNADGTGKTNLTNRATSDDEQPSWSPDGTQIAFQSNRDGDFEIYVMNADGSNPQNISNDDGVDFAPAWSRDGAKILFSADRGGARGDLFIMNVDGSEQTQLTADPNADFEGSWSPDGTQVAFTTERHGIDEIYIMTLDAMGNVIDLQRITDNSVNDGSTSWSPE